MMRDESDTAASDEGPCKEYKDNWEVAGLTSSVAPAAARFSGRMAPMRWASSIRAVGAVLLALVDPMLIPAPSTVRIPWLSGMWTAWIQIVMLVIHVRSTQVPLTCSDHASTARREKFFSAANHQPILRVWQRDALLRQCHVGIP